MGSWVRSALALVLAGTAAAQEAKGYNDADAAAAKKLFDERIRVLDVRTGEEYADGHLPGAQWIPVQELESRIAELGTGNDAPLLVYCRSGNRSARASQILVDNGFTRVTNMLGGFSAWSAASYPSETGLPQTEEAAPFEWHTATPESHGLTSEKFDALKNELAAHRTKAFLVLYDDQIVYEWYAPDHGPTQKHMTASMAKAVVGGLAVGVAMTDGLIALDDKAAKFVPQWRDDPMKSQILVRHLGSHTSGLKDSHNEQERAAGMDQAKYTGWEGEFWRWRTREPAQPDDAFTLSRDTAPVLFAPGTDWAYSNPGIAMMDYVLAAALKDAPHKDVRTLLRERVMRPIGVPDVEWSCGYGKTEEVDGLPLVASWGGGNYSARATARIGRLMLREGNWQGRQLLSADAVRQITRDVGTPGPNGIGWWSNNDGHVAALPRDAFWGAGASGQVVLVVPSLKLVAVRNGQGLDDGDNDEAIEKYVFTPLARIIGSGNE